MCVYYDRYKFRFKITALTVWQRPCQLKFRHSEHTPDTDGEHVTFNMSLVKLQMTLTIAQKKTNSRKKSILYIGSAMMTDVSFL